MRLSGVVLLAVASAGAQVIEFESGGLRYQALTRDGLTVMIAPFSSQISRYSVLQVAISNGSKAPCVIKPEDFIFHRDDATNVGIPAAPARTVVYSLLDKASRSDVIRLITTYEAGLYGNIQYKGTNGYEQRRQNHLAEFGSTRIKAAAAASAIALVLTKLAPGQSTDGAVFYATSGKPLGNGVIRLNVAGALFEFPVVSSK